MDAWVTEWLNQWMNELMNEWIWMNELHRCIRTLTYKGGWYICVQCWCKHLLWWFPFQTCYKYISLDQLWDFGYVWGVGSFWLICYICMYIYIYICIYVFPFSKLTLFRWLLFEFCLEINDVGPVWGCFRFAWGD